jgi:DNA (cytosine-5)-methyltransferase 1
VLWAKRVRPRIIILENDEEFRDWGPLVEIAPGRWMPCPDRRGETFNRWVGELRRLGYRVEWRELRACDFGAPTIRKRLFMIARRDGCKIVWPKPTHGPKHDADVAAGRKSPWRTAADIIDWDLPCHSIFLTHEEGRAVGVKRPLADATMDRIAKGVKRYVLDAAEPFIIPVTHQGDSRVHSVKEPLRTITTARRGEHAFVAPVLAGCGGRAAQSPPKSVSSPMNTLTAKADQILVAAFLAQHNLGVVARNARDPVSTITSTGAQQAVVSAGMLHLKGSDRRGAEDGGRQRQRPVAAGARPGRFVRKPAGHVRYRREREWRR